jgi:ribosomal protein S18 acetylase RimI-like enzyme
MTIAFQTPLPSDIKQLLNFMRQLYEHDQCPFNEISAEKATALLLMHPEWGNIWFITQNEEKIGYLVLTFGFSIEFHGRDALLDELFISEKYRGQGIGQQALRFVEDVCSQNQIEAIHLEVDRKNLRAQEIYRKTGFVDHDRYLMTKWLSS